MNERPIGIFDSGIGGLTVAQAIRRRLPSESMIYFGDTAHLPYGDKSEAAVQAYSIKITDVLLNKGCKVIVIACNSASSAAYELLKAYAGKRAKIINVIDPMVEVVSGRYRKNKIGLIGTKRTVSSGVYLKKIKDLNNNIDLKSLATPLLVPMIEEGFFNQKISHDIIENYLTQKDLQSIKALILGCTHYPLIKEEISAFYKEDVEVLDSSEVTANYVYEYLVSHNWLSSANEPTDEFLVSDYTDSFEASTKLFFEHQVHLEHYPLWE
ncbi:glutamate racemase [Fulvivirga sp. M361]|uniref:glutamate racemase n=1 Tax=Fulvivirga sp. M361 TaxID=2594266 RepID=UPI00117BD5C9|nr:glutamate racemase [Fulvivirga sp. M361]TRX56085.1 glutamate racemase [Fulvivirga sp. M361]